MDQDTIDFINKQQANGSYHPHTCCGFEGCKKPEEYNSGVLIATLNGLVCPCGKYEQHYRK